MRKASLGTLFLTVFLDLLGFGLVVPFLPGVARDLGASDLGAALLGAAYSGMQFLFIPVWGRLSDRFGRRPILLFSILATALAMAGLGFAHSVLLLFAARVFGGMATANIAVAQAYIADVTTPETRARGMGLIGMAFGLGFIFGPLMGGVLGQVAVFGRQGPLAAFVAAGLSLLNFFLAWRFVPESLPPERRHKAAPRRLLPLNLADLRQLATVPGLILVATIGFVLTFFFSGMEVTFRLFTEDAFGMSVAGTGYVFVLIGVVAAITQGGLIGPLSRRFGENRLLVVGPLILASGFALVGGAPWLDDPWPDLSLPVFLSGAVLIALGNGLAVPSLSSYASRQAGATTQGMTLGVMQSLGALARTTGPFLGGAAYEFIAIWGPYMLGAAGLIAVGLVARRLPPLRSAV